MAPDAVGRLQRRTADGKKSGAMVSSAHQPTSAQGRKACSEGQFDDDDDVKGSMRYNHRHVLVVLTTAV